MHGNQYFWDTLDEAFWGHSGGKLDRQEDRFVFELEVPGFNKDNLEVEFENGILGIKGDNGKRKLERRYNVSGLKDIVDVKASVKDGILEVSFIKDTSKQLPKRISLE